MIESIGRSFYSGSNYSICSSITQVLKSREITRILLLPGPSDAETLTIHKQVLKSIKESETVFLQPKVLKHKNFTSN